MEDFRREFVSDVEAVGHGVATLKYLNRYVFRTAITDDRMISMNNGRVTFRYRPTRQSSGGESRDRLMTLPVFEFLRRDQPAVGARQHVLPRRLQKIRHYGFLSRRSNIDLNEVRAAILDSLRDIEPDLELEVWAVPSLCPTEDDGLRCPSCGGRLIIQAFHRIRPPPLTQRASFFSSLTIRR